MAHYDPFAVVDIVMARAEDQVNRAQAGVAVVKMATPEGIEPSTC
ncbi:hypothetical protein [Roseicyclus sp.]